VTLSEVMACQPDVGEECGRQACRTAVLANCVDLKAVVSGVERTTRYTSEIASPLARNKHIPPPKPTPTTRSWHVMMDTYR
jgi:hypothetical protein